MRQFDPGSADLRENYQMLTRIVSPRPIAFVSSISRDGKGNLAPFSYFNLGGANPPSVVFSVLNDRRGAEKDTLRNIRETQEYVINVVTRAMAGQMNVTSISFPRGVDEFDQAGFTKVPSVRVTPPRVGESPVAMECRLHAIVPHGDGPLAGHYIIGQVLLVHLDEAFLDADGRPDPPRLDLIGRLGADWYVHAAGSSLFELPRPQDSPAQRASS
jgi:flavin reductase (DIM6/NTAB) family NADH-FMN oxidoreductase RutF